MGKTIIVSNRLPVKVTMKKSEFSLSTSEGGLATGLSSILNDENNIWIGWSGMEVEEDKHQQIKDELGKQNMVPVFLSQDEIKQFYEGFSNEIIWPVFHYMSTYARFENSYWDCYTKVNKKFKEVILSILEEGDTLWIHDYQLLLLPALIRQEREDVSVGFFLHIPFPSFELFRLIPWRKELLNGMLGADLLGFHTYDDANHFINSVTRLLPDRASSNTIFHNGRQIVVEQFPMGIDADKFESLILDAAVKENIAQLKKNFKNTRIILSIDRLDYSKGILQRVQAFYNFLKEHEEYVERVSLYMIVVPSRDSVQQYKDLKDEIDKLVGSINARYRTNNWTPIHYFYRSFPIEELSSLYHYADVCLVTPMRDGMNLVCKEYIASRIYNNGVLILSEMAGASKELIDAIIVNPNNINEMSEAMVTALNMPGEEQVKRMEQMRELVKKYNVYNWVTVFMNRLSEVKQRQQSLLTRYISPRIHNYIKSKYALAKKRLLLLDYDGTLVGFNEEIDKAVPDKELYGIIESLIKDEKNNVVIISGRKHITLEQWFGHFKIDLIGEHGVWHKINGKWEELRGLSAEWKRDIEPVLNSYTEKTPGSFIEEKNYSLVWHYRKAETELGEKRANELINTLRYIIADRGLQLLPGNKVVEVKNIEVNKGKAALYYTKNAEYDFKLAMGDDVTDEDLFKALSDQAITIKVNGSHSAAKYYLNDYNQVRNFLKSLPSKTSLTKIMNRFKNLLPYSSVRRRE